jgi:hypothetical protein
MNQLVVDNALNYAASLVNVPFRWYEADVDAFVGDDKFWCENSNPPNANEIFKNDKSIVCAGFPNLIRRHCGLSIPGLNGSIKGEYNELYKIYPGGTGAWFLYLYQNKRLEKLQINKKYPKGTLLIARYRDDIIDQGHLAVVYDEPKESKAIIDQNVIHARPFIDYSDRKSHKNHGNVIIESFSMGNDIWKYDESYYEYVCLPENWLIVD